MPKPSTLDLLDRIALVIALLCFGIAAIFAVATVGHGLDDVNLMLAFNTDEFRATLRVMENLKHRDFDPQSHFNYGHIYESLAILLCRLAGRLGHLVDARYVATVLRLISWASFAACFGLLGAIGRRLSLPWGFSLLFSLCWCLSPDFYFWSQTVHPDILQMAFILGAFYFLFGEPSFKKVALSTALAAAACGTKYSGIFLLPFVLLPVVTEVLKKHSPRVVSKKILFLLGVFFVIFFATNPYILLDPKEAWGDFSYERQHVATGDGKVEPASPFLWIPVMEREMGWTGLILLAVGLAFYLSKRFGDIRKSGWRKALLDSNSLPQTILAAFSMGVFLYFFLTVRMRVPRFLFPVYPILWVIAGAGIFRAISKFKKAALATPFYFLLAAYAFAQTTHGIEKTAFVTHKSESPVLKHGQVLQKCFAPHTRILTNPYTFVPSTFTNIFEDYEFTWDRVREFNPEVVVMTHSGIGRWTWKKDGTSFRDEQLFASPNYPESPRVMKFVQEFLAKSSGWSLVFEDHLVGIFKRKKAGTQECQIN